MVLEKVKKLIQEVNRRLLYNTLRAVVNNINMNNLPLQVIRKYHFNNRELLLMEYSLTEILFKQYDMCIFLCSQDQPSYYDLLLPDLMYFVETYTSVSIGLMHFLALECFQYSLCIQHKIERNSKLQGKKFRDFKKMYEDFTKDFNKFEKKFHNVTCTIPPQAKLRNRELLPVNANNVYEEILENRFSTVRDPEELYVEIRGVSAEKNVI